MNMTTTPKSRVFGTDLGTPIDRFYIDSFIQKNCDAIFGKVLEVGDSRYARRFGKDIEQLDVLSLESNYIESTLIGNLETGEGLPIGVYDCFLCTQVLQFVFNLQKSIQSCVQVLKPGGVLLVTVPGISQISKYEYDTCGEYWRFTVQSLQRLWQKESLQSVAVESHGNFYSSISFLDGLPIEQVDTNLLCPCDELYQMIIVAKVIK